MLFGKWVIYDIVAGSVKEAGAKTVGVIVVFMEGPTEHLTDVPAVGYQIRVVTCGSGKVMLRRSV